MTDTRRVVTVTSAGVATWLLLLAIGGGTLALTAGCLGPRYGEVGAVERVQLPATGETAKKLKVWSGTDWTYHVVDLDSPCVVDDLYPACDKWRRP